MQNELQEKNLEQIEEIQDLREKISELEGSLLENALETKKRVSEVEVEKEDISSKKSEAKTSVLGDTEGNPKVDEKQNQA